MINGVFRDLPVLAGVILLPQENDPLGGLPGIYANASGEIVVGDGDVIFGDGIKLSDDTPIVFGDDEDGQIYSDGNNMYMVGAGDDGANIKFSDGILEINPAQLDTDTIIYSDSGMLIHVDALLHEVGINTVPGVGEEVLNVGGNIKADGLIDSNLSAAFPISEADVTALSGFSGKTSLVGIINEVTNSYSVTGEPTGFEDRADTTISFVNGTLTFTIQPSGSDFNFYISGHRYNRDSSDSVVITDTEGPWFIMYDNSGTLIARQTTWDFKTEVPITFIYWDATNKLAISQTEERHLGNMSGETHEYLHYTRGTTYESGLTPGDYTIGGNGEDNAHARLSIADGFIRDEDIRMGITHSASPSNPFEQILQSVAEIPVFYLLGAANSRKRAATTFPVYDSVGTGRLGYNLDTAGTWSVAEVGDNDYVAMWLFATNNYDEPVVAFLGQRTDSSLVDAKLNNNLNDLVWGTYPFEEIRAIARLIFRTKNTMSNDVQATLEDLEILLQEIGFAGGSFIATAHSSTTGRSEANSHPAIAISTDTSGFSGILSVSETDVQLALNVIDGITLEQVRANGNTLSGDIDLNSNFLLNVPTPTLDGHAVNKAYADALMAANDAMVFKGFIDCSTNPNYPAADTGHTYKASVAGKIGGASGEVVEIGDMITCLVDSTPAGDQATVGANWNVTQVNLDGAVTGPASSVDNEVTLFSGTSGRIIKSSGKTIVTALGSDDLTIPTSKAVKDVTDPNTTHRQLPQIAQLENLTVAEVQQLENIGTTTISSVQWGYLGNLNQALTTGSNVAFNQINLGDDKKIYFGANDDGYIEYDETINDAIIISCTSAIWMNDSTSFNWFLGGEWNGNKNVQMGINHSVSGIIYIKIDQGTDSIIINGEGLDADTIIRGDTINNLGYFDAGLDKVGVGVQPATADWEIFNVDGAFMTKEVATPANQVTGYGKWYFKTDGKPYAQSDGGTEYPLSGGASVDFQWVPAGAFKPTITNGCSHLVSRELTAGRPEITSVNFDGTTKEYAQFTERFPDNWNNGTITFKVHWSSTATDTDGVVWGLQAVACNDGDPIDVVFGTAIEVVDNAQSVDGKQYISAVSAALTIAGSPTSGEEIKFQIYRDPANGSDTMSEDAELLGIEIFFDLA